MLSNETVKSLVGFASLVHTMRYWQKRFFKTRDYLDMEQVKACEKEVDAVLKKIMEGEPKSSGQEDLF